MTAEPTDSIRLDKWLWAARFFKTRSLAAEAIAGGKVQLNGTRVKRSKVLHVGDGVRIRKGPYEHVVTVRDVSGHRGSAADAAWLYTESPESLRAREELAEQLRLAARTGLKSKKGRPTKKDRRLLSRLRGKDV